MPGEPSATRHRAVWRFNTPNAVPTEGESSSVANIKSQLKRIKTNAKRTERNKAYKSEMRTWIRKFRVAAAAGDKDEATKMLHLASKKLDKAVSKGVIHKNQAANKKSAMAKVFHTMDTPA